MVPVIYVIAGGLALWGIVVIVSGDLVAMLDIATTLFGAAAIVAGLGAVAGALNRISRTINRITVEATDLQEAMAGPSSPMVYTPQDEPYAADSPDQSGRARKREARVRRKARGAASDALDDGAGEPPPLPIVSPAVTEERLGSGARAWVERRETPESYAPRRRAEPQPSQPPPADVPHGSGSQGDIVRSGTLNGVLYRFYADGSVEAVTPSGLRRFGSMEELREVIVASRGGIAGRPAGHEEPAADADEAPYARLPPAPQLPVYAETETAEEVEEAEPAGEEQLTPEKRLELFQQNIWATTLAELRRSPERRNRDEGGE